jgi:hypothetical protein
MCMVHHRTSVIMGFGVVRPKQQAKHQNQDWRQAKFKIHNHKKSKRKKTIHKKKNGKRLG